MVYTFKEPHVFARLVRALAPNSVLVHVDAKVSEDVFRAALSPEDVARVVFIAPRVQVNWAGYSQLTAVRALVKSGLEIASPNEYLVMLSGQDYPLWSNEYIEDYLRVSMRRQFLHYFRIQDNLSQRHYFKQVAWKHYRDLQLGSRHIHIKYLRKMRTAAIRGLEWLTQRGPQLRVPSELPYGVAFGGTHFAITASFARDLEDMVTADVEDYFSKIFCPEEHFYQTLAMNSQRYEETGGKGYRGSEAFRGPGTFRYSNLHLIFPKLEKVLTLDDLPTLSKSEKLFTRKFSARDSLPLMAEIDNELRLRTVRPIPNE